ncbi:hypothetical protein D3C83_89440 [compost metagenome]
MRQLQDLLGAELVQPAAVKDNLGLLFIEDLESLVLIGFGVLLDLPAVHFDPQLVLARRIPDLGGKIADKKIDNVAQVLELAQFAQ